MYSIQLSGPRSAVMSHDSCDSGSRTYWANTCTNLGPGKWTKSIPHTQNKRRGWISPGDSSMKTIRPRLVPKRQSDARPGRNTT
eukprot:5080400-Prymnesium_polylepis.1